MSFHNKLICHERATTMNGNVFSDEYQEGYSAYTLGLIQADNPHPSVSQQEDDWNLGWETAQADMFERQEVWSD